MKKRIGYIFGIATLALIGIIVTASMSLPERVVLYQGVPETKIVPAAALISTDTSAPSVQSFNDVFVQIADAVNPAVVTITTEKVIKNRGLSSDFPGFDGNDLFWQFFGGIPESEARGTVLGSGVIVSAGGFILTNNHVVEQGEKIHVSLMDKSRYEAKVIGTDPRTDLAVIKIEAKDLKPAILGDSDALRVGEWVVAIGSPFSENLDHTVTAGIVSAKGRSNIVNNSNYESFIQTDAAINPGNSGGALVNIRGELIGINTAIATNGGVPANLGVGFAIPINLAKKIMTDLIEDGKVTRAWLGVRIQDVDDRIAKSMKMDSRKGALVGEVVKDGPAASAGMKVGDIIVEFDGKKIDNSSQLRNLVSNAEIGKEKEVVVLRGKQNKTIKVKLGVLPEDENIVGGDSKQSPSKWGFSVDEITSVLAKQYGIDKETEGVVVTRVDLRSEAGKILRPGDVIQRVSDREIKNLADYKDAIKGVDSEFILVLVLRDHSSFFATLEVPK
ncbi:MAG: Do family serine endopeptidase [Candidatus Neomarinimicrobiota bacterium]